MVMACASAVFRDLRPGRHLIQLVNRRNRVSEDLHRNNYIAVNFDITDDAVA